MTFEIFVYYKVDSENETTFTEAARVIQKRYCEFPECLQYRIYRGLDPERKHTWMEWGQFTSRSDFENIFRRIGITDAYKRLCDNITGGHAARKTEYFTEI